MATTQVVARGKIKVDARKALHKLRDHMLVDLHLWATEIARVAVAIGATYLDVDWDADDVILSFDGRPLAPAAIASVRDHVLGGEGGTDENDALRLLGIGVTAALGLGASFVDVHSAGSRLRFEGAYIEDETSPLPAPEPTDEAAMRVHVRKKLGLEMLGRAVKRNVPREVLLLVSATVDSPLVVRAAGVDAPAKPPEVILRVDLDVPEAQRAVLEVSRPVPGWRAESVFLERGVRLVTYARVDAWGLDDHELPLRVVVDAKRLPTNASRSELRADSELVRRVNERIPRALEVALEALLAEPKREEKEKTKIGHAVEIVDARGPVRNDAFGAIAASIALAVRAEREVPKAAHDVLYLPLLQDAVGEPLNLTRVLDLMTRPPVRVFRGERPESPLLGMWLSGMPWLRGATVERVLQAEPIVEGNELLAAARAGGARRARALAHPPSRPILARSPTQLIVEAFEVKEGRFAGLEGEVAISKRQGELRRSGNMHVFVEERLLEIIPLPGTALPIDMALAWPDRFRPRRAYDGVERTDAIEEAVHYALRVAAVAIGERLAKEDPELARLAIDGWLAATRRLQDVEPSLAALGSLANAPVWPTSEPGVLTTIAALDAYIRRTRSLCTAPAGAGRAVDGRPVLDETHASSVRAFLPDNTLVVSYARSLAVAPVEPLEWIGREAASMVAYVQITRPNVAGIVGVAADGGRRHRVYHRGALFRDTPRPMGASLVIEDFAAVPNASSDVLFYSTPAFDIRREEEALLEIVVDRCERGDLDPALVERFLGDAAEDAGGRDPKLHARIVDIPKRAARARAAACKSAHLARSPDATPRPTGPSGSVTVLGTGTATAIVPPDSALESWIAPPAVVLYGGRPLGPRATIPVTLPIVVFVETAREEHIDEDWTSLSPKGEAWAKEAVLNAAVDLVKNAAKKWECANDVGVLRLVAALLDESRTAERIEHALRKTQWPTVQGGTWSIGKRRDHTVVNSGQRAYASWLTDEQESPYDEPAVLIPKALAGELRARILGSLGCKLTDMTETIARLQEQRARRQQSPPPKLAGEPLHPSLRVTLAALGATAADGEIEIIEAARPDVHRVDASGVASPFEISTPLPVRVVFRCAEWDVIRAVQEISETAEKLVRKLAKNSRDLPPAVRAAARVLLCATVARSGDAGDLERLALFPDVMGKKSFSLADMRNEEKVHVVTWSPPHPEPDGDASVVFLWPTEKEALAHVVRFVDVGGPLLEIALGDQRRAAPPIATAVLDDDLRRACLLVVPVSEGSLTGEVGVLPPAHVGLRGIRLHHTMRPLATLHDGGGWPFVAVVNDDSAKPTRAFTGLASQEDVSRIRAALRAALASHVTELFPLPDDVHTLGVVRLGFPFWAQPNRTPCIGVLWVDTTWPERPEVHVEAPGHVDPFHVPRTSGGGISKIVPVRGKILVACDANDLGAALGDVFLHVQKRLGSIVASAARAGEKKVAPEALAAYEWDVRLLGERTDRDPTKELAADRPDEILLRVVARRAPHLLHIEETPPPSAPPTSAPPPMPAAEPRHLRTSEAREENRPRVELAPASSPPSFFHGLARRIVELVSGPEPPTDPALASALGQAVVAMKLTGNPVSSVREARSGRPIRFDVETRTLVVNTRHGAVSTLAQDPSRTLFLVAAAVSEVNRQLEYVTDAEELNIILDLLRRS